MLINMLINMLAGCEPLFIWHFTQCAAGRKKSVWDERRRREPNARQNKRKKLNADAKPARLRSEPRALPRPARTRRAFTLLRDHTSPSEQNQAVLLQEVAQE